MDKEARDIVVQVAVSLPAGIKTYILCELCNDKEVEVFPNTSTTVAFACERCKA